MGVVLQPSRLNWWTMGDDLAVMGRTGVCASVENVYSCTPKVCVDELWSLLSCLAHITLQVFIAEVSARFSATPAHQLTPDTLRINSGDQFIMWADNEST